MNLKPYPEYKDSGVEWIGEIPVSWGIFKLKHVINEFISGGTPNSDNEKFWVQDEKDGIPWVAIGDMTNNEVVVDTKKKITLDGLANKKLRILKSGTIIYSIFASLGKVSLLGIDATTNQAILGLITNEKIDGTFLKYYLRYLEQPIIALSNANTQNNLNSTIVKNIEFSLPKDYNNQKKIASFLDKKTSEIDLTIEKDTLLIELLKEKRTALINHVVTKGLDPKAEMKDSGVEWIGEIPSEWEVRKLGFYLDLITYGFTNPMPISDKGPDLITAEGVNHGKVLYSKCRKTTNEAFRLLTNKSRPKINDILLTKDGTLGRVALVTKEDCCINQSVALLRPNNKIIPKYLKFLIESPNYQHRMKFEAKGTTIKHIQITILNKMEISVPPIQEQKQIIEYFEIKTNKIDHLIQKIQNNIKLLEEYKKSLIHHVVTGKVDVREVAV